MQFYVRDIESSVQRPEKELKGFVKVALQPWEEQMVTFTLNKRSFAFYNVELKDWHPETGDFEIFTGKVFQRNHPTFNHYRTINIRSNTHVS